MSTSRAAELAPVVEAAQRVAGALAARGRGDHAGAREMLASFDEPTELAGGALLVAELTLALLSTSTGESLDECVRDLCVTLERSLT
ncbi:hypothetical protein [Nocardioides sp. R-C-SC26]|uniref:hypothetical protein n=1 Tax=Nocardioides sp. R-C-SC26 TaxID=2870414 RepID=UPI001E49EC8A|nr:hypothetical protein [Nocardioides sp. R-C-SC26]